MAATNAAEGQNAAKVPGRSAAHGVDLNLLLRAHPSWTSHLQVVSLH